MENLIAIIKEGKVSNVIIGSDEFANSLPYETVNVTNNSVNIGDSYFEGVFQSNQKDTSIEEEITLTKEEEEKLWRDFELNLTDYIVPIIDHPQHAAYMTYRQELRDYPLQSDFPNGTRPLKP